MQKVRLIDIAQKLGVSTVTVHNALSGKKGVSASMRARILETAKEMGYESAIVLEKKCDSSQAWTLGAIIAENYLAQYATYYWKMYQEFALAAAEKHCLTVIEALKKDAEMRTMELPESLRNKDVDGLVVIGELNRQYVQNLRARAQVPIVYLDFYDSEIAHDCVIADNFYGMYQMTELLFAQGMENLAFVGSIHATSSIRDRYCGFVKALIEHHKNLPEEWLIEDRDEMGNIISFALPRCMPDAFACNCDLVAAILIEKLHEKGYRVPEDISVTGFDNFVRPGYPDSMITTYEADIKAMTKAALNKLLKRLHTPDRRCALDVVPGHVRWKNSVKMNNRKPCKK